CRVLLLLVQWCGLFCWVCRLRLGGICRFGRSVHALTWCLCLLRCSIRWLRLCRRICVCRGSFDRHPQRLSIRREYERCLAVVRRKGQITVRAYAKFPLPNCSFLIDPFFFSINLTSLPGVSGEC